MIQRNGATRELMFSLPSLLTSDVIKYFISNTQFTPTKSKLEEIIHEYLAFFHKVPYSQVKRLEIS